MVDFVKEGKTEYCKICIKEISTLWGKELCGKCTKGIEAFDGSSSRMDQASRYLFEKARVSRKCEYDPETKCWVLIEKQAWQKDKEE